METLLAALMKDAQAAKFGPIRSACQLAIGKQSAELYITVVKECTLGGSLK